MFNRIIIKTALKGENMKKLFHSLLLLLLIAIPKNLLAQTEISTPNPEPCYANFRVYVDKTAAVANNNDSINFTVKWRLNDDTGCTGGGPLIDYIDISTTGTGNTFSKTRLNKVSNIDYFVANNELVYETTSLKSSVQGEKSISIIAHWDIGISDPAKTVGKVTFTAPPVVAPTPVQTTPKPTPKAPTQAAAPVEQPKTPPAVPILENIKVGDTEVAAEKVSEQTFTKEEKKIFSGKTIPNGLVKLYFHSEPFEDTVRADSNGIWSYELNKDLGEGEHSLQIAVTDTTTNLTSEKTQPVKFVLIASEQVDRVNTPEFKKANHTIYYALGIAVFLATLLIGYLLYKRRSKLAIK